MIKSDPSVITQRILHFHHLISLTLLTVLLFLIGCARSTSPASTQVRVKNTASATDNLATAKLVTATPTPSSFNPIATIEPTWTPRPTSTLLVPTPATGQDYQLTIWTPEKAEQLIAQLNKYPETLSLTDLGYIDSAYSSVAYQYEGLAELESAMRFPQSDQEKTWRWNGAYTQDQSMNQDVNGLYTSLITAALNQQETSLDDLPAWFANTEPRLSLELIKVKPPAGYHNSVILHIQTNHQSKFTGGFAFWLLQKGGAFTGYPLPNLDNASYHEMVSKVETEDVTGDGFPEALIQNVEWQSFGMHSGALTIYRLDQVPPKEIPIDPALPDEGDAVWLIDQMQSVPTVTFQMRILIQSLNGCGPMNSGWQYRWQGEKLELVKIVPPPLEEMEQYPYCARVLAYTLDSPEYFDHNPALETFQQLLDLPFITKDTTGFESVDFLGKTRLDLAIYLADSGDDSRAREQIQKLSTSADPTHMASRKTAAEFFSVRRDPQQLFQFCLTSRPCASFLTLSEMISLIPSNRFADAEMVLKQMGMDIQSSGMYDFDQDGRPEKWLLLPPYGGDSNIYPFWILANLNTGIHGRQAAQPYIGQGEREGVTITRLARSGGLPAYQVSLGQHTESGDFLYWPLDQEDPTLSVSQAGLLLDQIQDGLLLKQVSPKEAIERISNIQKQPVAPGQWTEELQGQLLYLLGLAQELNGEGTQAAQTYLTLWQSFPNNPYAVMAFAKLEPAP